ncbi:MAG TPA: hypothetical protein VN741_18220 [Mycobacterium sp.]|nr:hypothetical protein [Mycobacterium sp.]
MGGTTWVHARLGRWVASAAELLVGVSGAASAEGIAQLCDQAGMCAPRCSQGIDADDTAQR